MPRLRFTTDEHEPDNGPAGLPVRWAVIAILTTAAAVVGLVFGGPVAAITAGAAVATAAHKLLA